MRRIFFVTIVSIVASLLLPALSGAQEECPNEMVSINGMFCIDRYEYPNRKGVIPEKGLTWQEAAMACKDEGKRLCTYEEWKLACQGQNGNKYPYGNQFQPGACNDSHTPGDRDVMPSGSMQDCVSDFGVYDMSGNVWEWISDSYKNGASRGVRGGSPASTDPEYFACDVIFAAKKDTVYEFNGARCCAKPLYSPQAMETGESGAQAQAPPQQEGGAEKAAPPPAIEKPAAKPRVEKAAAKESAPAAALTPGSTVSPLTGTPSISTPGGVTASIEYVDLGDLIETDTTGSSVSASAIGLTVGYKFENNASIDFTHVDYKADASTAAAAESFKTAIDVFHIGYSLPVIGRFGSWSTDMSAGLRYANEDNGKAGEVYVTKLIVMKDVYITPGINYTDSWATDDQFGFTLDIRYGIRENLDFIARYNSNDFFKLISNYNVTPESTLGIPRCTSCDEDSMSLGFAYELPGPWGNVYLMWYDLGDRDAPLAGTTLHF